MAAKSKILVVGTLHGGPPLQRSYPEAASQTFVEGEAVYLNGSGHVAEYTLAIDDGTQRFLGFAAEAGENNATAAAVDNAVYLGWGTIFEANVTNNGVDQTTSITQIGTLYPLYEDATNGIVMIDIGDTGSQIDCVKIIQVDKRAAAGETNGRVEFHLTDVGLQIGGN